MLGRFVGRGGLPRRVVFLHVPKSAGMSIHAFFLARASRGPFRRPRLVYDRVLHDRALLSQVRRWQYVGGHFGAEVLARVRGDGVAFTVLRDPLDRLVSAWRFSQTLRDPALRLPFETLEEALSSDHPRVREGLDNPIARQLAAAYELSEGEKVPRDEWIGRARATLESLDFVGSYRRLDDDFARLLDILGMARQPLQHANRTSDPNRKHRDPAVPVPPVPPEPRLRELAEPWIALDRAVCEGWL